MIPLAKPYIGEEEKRAVCEVLDSGWVSQGPKVAEFEAAICFYTGAKYAVACSSCTSALHLALLALGVGPHHIVNVPGFTFTATANAVEYTGAKTNFVDIDKSLGMIAKKALLPHPPDAVIAAQLFGQGVDMRQLLLPFHQLDIPVVEDAACGLGATYLGRHAGTLGTVGCYSFHPRKSITCGEGGMLVTDSEEIAITARMLRNQGMAVDAYLRHTSGDTLMLEYEALGYNYRMTDIQAAIGIEQLKKLPMILAIRREIAARYDKAFNSVPWITIPPTTKGWKHSYQSYIIRVPRAMRNPLMSDLQKKGIATRQGTHAVCNLPYYRQRYGPATCPNALAADRETIALPIFFQLTPRDQEYIIGNVIELGGVLCQS